MESRVHETVNITTTEAYASTDVALRGVEGQNEAMTLVMVVIGIIFAIIILFLMGIFIDCRHLKKESMRGRRPRLSELTRRRRKDDVQALASDMSPNGINEVMFRQEADDTV
ncbi:hypothetical protein HN011_008980 [Eciton burchellii]|nr:hypothetical protein HN011_008980 [Eciton burchellii]